MSRLGRASLRFVECVLQPLSLVILYWFVFTYMFTPRGAVSGNDNYILFLIAGLLPWLGINEDFFLQLSGMRYRYDSTRPPGA